MSGYASASTNTELKFHIEPIGLQVLSEILIASGHNREEIDVQDSIPQEIRIQIGQSIQPDSTDNIGTNHLLFPSSDLYIVGTGKVRLLAFDPQENRKITLKVLESGDCMGPIAPMLAESLIPYEVVGAGDGIVYRLPSDQLSSLLSRYHYLEGYLARATSEYQRIAFLRTQTRLKALSGKQFRELAKKIIEQVIPAQKSLNGFFLNEDDVYWLRSGQLIDHEKKIIPVGSSWYGKEVDGERWEAATDVVVHVLPAQESLEESLLGQRSPVASDLHKTLQSTASSSTIRQRLPVPASPQSRSVSSPAPSPQRTAGDVPSTASPAVIFPKPLRRRFLDKFLRFPWIEQQSSSDCGAACLAMIARYWGKRLPINFLREKTNVGRSGASLKSLARGAESIGFNARPVRASFSRIAAQTNPWIAHWQGDHYIVVYRIESHRVILADPAVGKRVISRDEFKTHWTGYGLLLDPTERLKDIQVRQASLGRYVQLLVPYRSLIFQILTVSLLIQVFSLITPLFTQIILDKVVVQRSMSTLNVFAVGLVIFSLWTVVMTVVRSYLLSYFSLRLDLTMVSGFIRHAISLPLKFYETRRVGDIITRVQENQKIQRFLISQVMLAWLGFLTGFVYLGLMMYYNWQLTLMVMALMPPIILVTLVSTPFLRQLSREIFKAEASQNSTLVEMMNGIAAVKSAGVDQEVRWRWEENLTQLQNVTFKGQKFGIGLEAVNSTVNMIGSAALLWIGAAMVIQDRLTIGQFVAFNMMIGYVLDPVVALANLWDELQEIVISVERLNDVFETQPEEAIDQPKISLTTLHGAVEFEQVTFQYDQDSDRNILENLTFQVIPGQTIAIVGRSGSGKTTLVKLLEGLYHPTQGKIFIDGHDVRHVSLHSLRTQLGVVPQECFLFSGTILENITLYRDYTLEQCIAAAKLAEAHAFIQELPLGYSTQVGERGTTLSGGQRQRIAIARALLGNPRVLVLDEATSSLDTESERRFQRNLSQISRDRTTFIIAHRLSTVRNADQILVLDKGILVEQGNHDELIAQKGLYWSLAQQQLDI